MRELAEKELERIEYNNRNWKNKCARNYEIWQEIAMNICERKNLRFWNLVMDLYKEKYRTNEKR
jgi:hypothetical protein